MFVHGRLNFYRNVDLIHYSFYKNMGFSLGNAIFQFHTKFGGATMFNSFLCMVYNSIFTLVPPVIYAVMERDVSFETMMDVPELFAFDGQKWWIQSYWKFWLDIITGAFHTCCSFYVPLLGMWPRVSERGWQIGSEEFGMVVNAGIIVLVNFQISVMSSYWTWIHALFVVLSIVLFPATVLIMDAMGLSSDMRGISWPLFSSGVFWANLLALTIVGMIPSVAGRVIMNSLNRIRNIARYREYVNAGNVKTVPPGEPENGLNVLGPL
jgi:magnesium-transporting ATPase (P-type)